MNRHQLHTGLPAHVSENGLEKEGEKELARGAPRRRCPTWCRNARRRTTAAGDGGADPEHAGADAREEAIGEEIDYVSAVGAGLDKDGGQEEAEEAADRPDEIGGTGALLVDQTTGEERGNRVNGHHDAVAEGGLMVDQPVSAMMRPCIMEKLER